MLLLGGMITIVNLVIGRKRENTFDVLALAILDIIEGEARRLVYVRR